MSRQVMQPGVGAPLPSRLLRSVGLVVAAAFLALPLAAAWGIGHAEADDYLGPHQAHFAAGYSSEIKLDLGPIGNAYLPNRFAPLGLVISIGGVGDVGGADASVFSARTLEAYAALYADPQEIFAGVLDRLIDDAVVETLKAEGLVVALFVLWSVRRRFLTPTAAGHLSGIRTGLGYLVVLTLVVGSIIAPPLRSQNVRIPVALAAGNPFEGVTVDSILLADILDRGIKGVQLLAGRQQLAVSNYVKDATTQLNLQRDKLAVPAEGESVMLGVSDLHCSLAMTQVIGQMAEMVGPRMIISAGDDTVNGTAAERGCITRERDIAPDAPFVVAGGNHDSDITETQMERVGMTVLDGSVVEEAGAKVLGDDDPELNVPFSVERTMQRQETVEQLGQRMVNDAAGKDIDVILVHQPIAAAVITKTPDPPAKLVFWGHYHTQVGPEVIPHTDGSWTVALQAGTAGGIKQPIFTSFSTPFSPPRTSADVYLFYRHDATGLITGVQALHFKPDGTLVIDPRITTGDVNALPPATRQRLGDSAEAPASTVGPR